MNRRQDTELLKMLWTHNGARRYVAADGREVEVRRTGEYDPATGRFLGAEIAEMTSGGPAAAHGNVIAGNPATLSPADLENSILHITAAQAPVVLKLDGSPLPQIVVPIDPAAKVAYDILLEGAPGYGCAPHVARMDDFGRVALFTRLGIDRVNRKYNEIERIYSESGQNLNETMYAMLMRTMGGTTNKEAFMELAAKVRYAAISRERNNIQYVEAMLLGTSGLLEMYDDDLYVRDLRRDFNYLKAKYSIEPMAPRRWTISRHNPYNHPVLRIAQLAAFLSTKEFLFENIIRCRSVDDLRSLFRAEASHYWSTHFIPGKRSFEAPKRIGSLKADLLGINLVAPMMFFYGTHTGSQELKEGAVELLENIGCERNRIVDEWRNRGVRADNAFDSQAILQLHNEHCLKDLCWQCAVGKRVVGKALGGR